MDKNYKLSDEEEMRTKVLEAEDYLKKEKK